MYTGPKLTNDNLVFGYDTGYGIADNNTATRFYPGAPATNLNTDPYHSTKSAGDTVSLATWGGDTGQGSFEVNTSPDGGGMMFINHNTSNPAGTGGAYYDFPSTRYTLTNGVTYTRSWWCKADRVLSSVSAHICSCNRDSDNTYIIGSNISLNQTWQRFSSTFTYTGPTSTDWQFRHINYNTSKIYIANVQLEVNDFASPSVDGTRANTASLIDLKRTEDISVANVSFNSTGQPTFDGTNDYIYIDEDILNVSNFTVEAIVNITSVGNYNKPIFTCGNLSSTGIWFLKHRSGLGNRLVMHGYDGVNPRVDVQSTNAVPDAENTHVAVTFNGTSYQTYINGVADGNAVTDNAVAASSDNYIGRQGSSGTYLSGEVPVLKIYNQALSADEIKRNYNAYKNRFNI